MYYWGTLRRKPFVVLSSLFKICKTRKIGLWCRKNDSNCSGWNTSLSKLYTTYDTCIGEDTGATYYKETACMTGACFPCDGKYYGAYEVSLNNTCKCLCDGGGCLCAGFGGGMDI